MAQLLYDWLNEQVVLTTKVTSFSEDFKDGYLLGNILYKYNQQINFNEFSSRGNPTSKLNNFVLLEPTMRKIGAHFNSKVVGDIMSGKENTVKNLLYEMKTLLEAIYRNSQQNSSSMIRGTSNDKALCVIAPIRPSYDKTKLATFSNAIHAQVESTNDALMAKAINRFTSREKSYVETMSSAETNDYEELMEQRFQNRELDRSRKAQAIEFSQTWEAHNIQQWKKNQRIAHDRRILKKKVEDDVYHRKETIETKVKMNTRNNTFYNIDEFDARLEANLLVAGPEEQSKEGNDSLIKTTTLNLKRSNDTSTVLYIDQNIQKKGLETTQKKMKEHHEDMIIKQQAHEQRRRKYLREYDTMQIKMSQKVFTTEVIAQLLNFSSIEEIENMNMDKVIKYKDIIPENRKNRQNLIDQMVASDAEKAIEWVHLLANREVTWNIGDSRVAHFHRSDVLLTSKKSADLEITTEFCLELIDKLLDVVDFVISCRNVGCFNYKITNIDITTKLESSSNVNTSSTDSAAIISTQSSAILPTEIWNDAIKMLISNLPVSESIAYLKKVNVSTALAPFAIASRPNCVNDDQLFKEPFHSETIFSCKNDSNFVGSDIAVNLSKMDTKDYIISLSDKDYSKEFTSISEQAVATSSMDSVTDNNEFEKDTLLTPDWIFKTAPCNILGEAIIASRTIVNPFQPEPSAILPTNHIPLRIAISSVSDIARKKFSTELANLIPGLLVIEVNQLVQKAFDFHQTEILNKKTVESNIKDISLDVQDSSQLVENQGNLEIAEIIEEKMENKMIESHEKYKLLAAEVHDYLMNGLILTDDIYISLIINLIEQIPVRNNGFVLQDFPTTKHQLIQFMQRLSGINYDSHRPQPIDYMTEYAPTHMIDPWMYDIKKCGLDALVHIDNNDGILTSLNERILARVNEKTGEIIYITENQDSIEDLKFVDDSYKSVLTSGIDLTTSELNIHEIVKFTDKIKLLDVITINKDITLDEAIKNKANELVNKLIPAENLLPGFITIEESISKELSDVLNDDISKNKLFNDLDENKQPDDEFIISVEESIAAQVDAFNQINLNENSKEERKDELQVDNVIANEENNTILETEEVLVTEQIKEKYIYNMPLFIKQENMIPEPLAKALVTMWNTCEDQSNRKSNSYFNGFRNIRYQMIQRRRAAYDCVTYLQVRYDNRQNIFDEFAKKFNSFDDDFRFDPDCISELHLIKLELVESLIKLSEQRKKEAEDYCNKLFSDSVVSLFIHRSKCEATSILQSEYQRFFLILHILFDFMKSCKGYDMNTRILNELEVTLPITLPSNDNYDGKNKSKEKDTKGKGGKDTKVGPIPFREPIAPVILPINLMQLIPEVNTFEDNVDSKGGKGKPPANKDKKGTVSDSDLFTDLENQIIEEMKKWCRDTFQVNREVYDGDEQLCSILEKTIWYEAEKLLISVDIIKNKLNEQINWLQNVEKEMSLILNDLIINRYHKELTAVNYLISLIDKNIANAKVIEMIWLVTPDAKPINPKKIWKKLFNTLPPHMRSFEAFDDDNDYFINNETGSISNNKKQEMNSSNVISDKAMSDKGLELIRAVNALNQNNNVEVPNFNFIAQGHFISKGTGKFASVDVADHTMTQAQLSQLSSIDSYTSFLSQNDSVTSLHQLNSDGELSPINSQESINMKKSDSGYDILSRPSSAISRPNSGPDNNSNNSNNSKPRSITSASRKKASFLVQPQREVISKDELERRKLQAIYLAKRLEFQTSLDKRRLTREKEFRSMGMTAPVAKLAAFNDLHLQDEQDLDDFDFMYKPKIKKNKNKLKQ